MARTHSERFSFTRWLPWFALAAALFALFYVMVNRDRPASAPRDTVAEAPATKEAFVYMGQRWVPDPEGRTVTRPDREMVAVGRHEGQQIYSRPTESGGGGGGVASGFGSGVDDTGTDNAGDDTAFGEGSVTIDSQLFLRVGENQYYPMVRR